MKKTKIVYDTSMEEVLFTNLRNCEKTLEGAISRQKLISICSCTKPKPVHKYKITINVERLER